MKKFLLFAAAALVAVSASAQLPKKHAAGKASAQKQFSLSSKQTNHKFVVAGEKSGVKATVDKSDKLFSKSNVNVKSIKQEGFKGALSHINRAAVQPAYTGFATQRSKNESVQWDVVFGSTEISEGQTVTYVQNLIPNIFGFEGGVLAAYTTTAEGIVIQPTLVASLPASDGSTTYYLFMESLTSSDGSITLTLNEDGSIGGTYSIGYSVYPNKTYNFDEWMQTYEGFANTQYRLPGQVVAPQVMFEPSNLILFAGLGLNGYSYNSNLSITGAFANTTFKNLTTDPATAWNWAAYQSGEGDDDPDVLAISSTDKDFVIPFGEDYVKNVQLTGTCESAVSEPFIFGVGKSKEEDGTNSYSNCYVYAGGTESSFAYNDGETTAIITRQDPDGDLTFYTNWATPDKAKNSMHKIYMYYEKPATPLYIEGVTLPLVGFTAQEGFNLKVKIYKASYPEGKTKPTLGDLIAEGDATSENINASFDMGLTAIEFRELYVEDEFGMSETLPYLFLDDEFIIVIEGWDNGTFSGVLGCQDAPLDNARISTWFEMTGEEGKMYSYTSWKTSLFVGLLGATYGYLHTDSETNITMPVAGGEASVNVSAMLRSVTEEGAYEPRIFIENIDSDTEISEETGLPAWLSIATANVNETADKFDLKFTAEALPDGIEGRYATIIFYQEGAQLKVNITQGNATGIAATKAEVKAGNAQMFNIAGQRVNNDYKGLVIKNGRKFMNK